MSGISVVARKEFFDHVTGRRFLVILTLLVLISAVAMNSGVDRYNNELDIYKERIAAIEELPGEESGRMPSKPSMPLLVFEWMIQLFSILGAILAITMGFDLISGEKESGSLKSLLSHPLFRDAVINGKAIGGIGALGLAMIVMALLSIGFIMMLGIIPSGDEFVRILVLMGFTLLFMVSFFSAALMSSAIARNSTRAILYSLLIYIVLSFVMPITGTIVGMEMVGDMPELPGMGMQPMNESESISEEELNRMQREFEEYWEDVQKITEPFTMSDPSSNYGRVASAVINPRFESSFTSGSVTGEPPAETTITEALGKVWPSLVVLITFPIIMFAIAYIRFMRIDLR
ncbi:MAG: ABC transporter permease subunit [Halobacteriota archaeon]|nr:ABC transporter permease subunit [Halobacteriota archaeon]